MTYPKIVGLVEFGCTVLRTSVFKFHSLFAVFFLNGVFKFILLLGDHIKPIRRPMRVILHTLNVAQKRRGSPQDVNPRQGPYVHIYNM